MATSHWKTNYDRQLYRLLGSTSLGWVCIIPQQTPNLQQLSERLFVHPCRSVVPRRRSMPGTLPSCSDSRDLRFQGSWWQNSSSGVGCSLRESQNVYFSSSTSKKCFLSSEAAGNRQLLSRKDEKLRIPIRRRKLCTSWQDWKRWRYFGVCLHS